MNVKEYGFDAKKVGDGMVEWLRNYFNNNGNPINAVIGVSGGKDSSVVLAALVRAIGPDRVYGVLMPNGSQKDISDSYAIAEYCGVHPILCNIEEGYNGIINPIGEHVDVSTQAKVNLAPIVRMATLKAIAQSVNGRYTCNANRSELYLGYYTLGADNTGAVAPLANLTSDEVVAVGEYFGIPDNLIHKTPADGLSSNTDEMAFGFTYSELNQYLITGTIENEGVKNKIEERHRNNLFKLNPMTKYTPEY